MVLRSIEYFLWLVGCDVPNHVDAILSPMFAHRLVNRRAVFRCTLRDYGE